MPTTVEERAHRAAYMRGWSARNRARLNAERRERYATDRQYREAKMGRARYEKLRQRGGLDSATTDFVSVLLADPCAYCGETMAPAGRITQDGASLDHIDPTGDSHWTNLTVSCTRCNASKGDTPLLLSMLERQLRKDLTPVAEQIWLIKGRTASRRRLEF